MKLFLLIFYTLCGPAIGDDNPTVEIPQGIIQGTYKMSYGNRTYSAFQGIPYAKPPLGDLRFAEPEPAQNWSGILVANKTYNCMCFIPFPLVYGVKGTEDCLYVYVYVPRTTIDGNENLDVVVHIHGGAFMLGSPSYMAGADYIMDRDVVYVSFNYRLAILGFLSTEDDVVSGNNGLKDQTLALKWIKDNIKYFGGNPNSVTLTGLSAGGASVHYHYLSPLSKGLFHRGFSQSGTALNSWALIENPLSKAQVIGTHLGCNTESTKLLVRCFRQTNAKVLLNAMKVLFVYMNAIPFAPFGPVVEKGENPFLPDYPYKLLTEGRVYDVPWIASNTKHEGIYPVVFFVMLDKLEELNSKWNEIMPYALDFASTAEEEDLTNIAVKIRQYYFKDEPLTEYNVFELVQIFTDRLFLIDNEKAIRLHSKAVSSSVYYYYFAYRLQQPFIYPGMTKGVSHGDDGRLLFKIIGSPRKLEDEDEKMMNIFTEFITVYAKTNKPTFHNIEWKPVSPGKEEIDILFVASPDSITMQAMDELGPTEFWESLPIKENENLVCPI